MSVASAVAALPANNVHDGYLYAVEFADGTVKVGASRSIRSRVVGLCAFSRRHGIEPVAVHAVRFRGKLRRAESAVLRKMGPPSHGAEWFSGCGIGAAVDAIATIKRATTAEAA